MGEAGWNDKGSNLFYAVRGPTPPESNKLSFRTSMHSCLTLFVILLNFSTISSHTSVSIHLVSPSASQCNFASFSDYTDG